MHSKTDNIEIMTYDKADEVIEERSESLLSKHQIGWKILMKGSDFIFNSANLLYYKCHKININCGRAYIDCPDWIKYKKGKKNLVNNNDKRF